MTHFMKHKKLYIVMLITMSVLAMGGLARRVGAVSWELPQRDTITNPDGTTPNGGVAIEIAQPGPNVNLDVNEAWAKVYIPDGVPDLTIQIGYGRFGGCGTNTFDSEGDNGPCDGQDNAVNYEYYYGDNTNGGLSPLPGGPAQVVNSNYFPDDNYKLTPSLPLPGYPAIDTGTGKYYVVFVRAIWANGGAGSDRINSFKVGGWDAGTLTSYWGYSNTSPGRPSGAGYAVQDRVHDHYTEDDMSFQFASPCSVTTAQTVYLKWTDADAYGAPNTGVPPDGNEWAADQEINFELQEADIGASSGGVILSVNSPPGSNPDAIGGNGDYREVSFTVRPDKVYIWKWKGVNRYNGVQMWIPYDSFYFGKNCGGPTSTSNIPKGVIDQSDCSAISGWAYDPDSSSTAIGIHIYVNGPAPAGDFYDYGATNVSRPDVNSAFGITGTHGFNWTVPSKYKDGNTYHFYLYARGVDSAGNGGGTDGDANNPQITAFSSSPNNGGIFSCPPPAAPTVSTVCQPDGTTTFTVNWNPGNTPAGTTQIYVDVNTSSSFPSSGPYWNKGPLASGATSTTGPSGFNTWPSGPAMPPIDSSNYYARVFYNTSSGGVHSGVSTPFTQACPPPLISCTSVNPSLVEAGGPAFTMNVSFKNAAGHVGLKNAAVVVSVAGQNSPSTGFSPNPLPGDGTTIAIVGMSVNPATIAPGAYDVTLQFSGGNSPAGTVSCNPIKLLVSTRPYFRAFNGDVIAGSNAACTSWLPHTGTSTGSILAYSNGSGIGAGTQLAAQALAVIDGFSSAQSRSPGPGGPDKGLAFANSAAGTYGGNFNAGGCPSDFWANRPTGAVSATGNLNLNPALTGTVIYQATGPGANLNLTTAANKLADGQTLALYVDGDVTIKENIITQNTSWASVNDIPSFVLIAHGDIYIDSSVSAIDGVLIAQSRSAATGGNIYTCSNGHALPSAADMADTTGICKANPLTITGSVIARTIKLFRTSGSVAFSSNGELPNGPTAHAAERFVYSPEVWVRANLLRGTPSLGAFDAITNLPPVF